MPKPLGEIIDQLGVKAEIEDSDLVASAVVVLSVLVDGDPHPRLTIANSEGLSWIEQTGLLRLAERIASEPPGLDDEE